MVVVADNENHRLALWRLGDGTVWKHLGSQGTEPGQFTRPKAVVVTRAGALVVTDEYRVQVLTVDGAVVCVLDPTAVVGVGRLGSSLFGISLYPGTDEILVTDYSNHRVVALSWSPEVFHFEYCLITPHDVLASFISLTITPRKSCFSAAYWMRGHLEVKARHWANSTGLVVSQSHPEGTSGWERALIIAWLSCGDMVPLGGGIHYPFFCSSKNKTNISVRLLTLYSPISCNTIAFDIFFDYLLLLILLL